MNLFVLIWFIVNITKITQRIRKEYYVNKCENMNRCSSYGLLAPVRINVAFPVVLILNTVAMKPGIFDGMTR